MAKVFSGEFGNTTGWTLVNDYTIHEPERLKDRPFMRTRVPKAVRADLLDLRLGEGVEWLGDRFADDLTVDDSGKLVAVETAKARKHGYAIKRSINGRVTFKDTVTIFSLEDGAIATFRSFNNVRITPLPSGHIGGKHKATTSDGIVFSGMSSRNVPEEGLMEGEPGRLWFDDGKNEPKETEAALNAELYLDEDQFNCLFEAIRDGISNIDVVRVSIVAELFEGEVQASLSEWWMPREYGMIKKSDWVQTRARIDSIHVGFSSKNSSSPQAQTDTTRYADQEENPSIATAATRNAETNSLLNKLAVRGGWILAALVVLIGITIFR